MSGYSTKKEDDGSHSVIDSLGFRTPYTGLSEADASYHAQRLNAEDNPPKPDPDPDPKPDPNPPQTTNLDNNRGGLWIAPIVEVLIVGLGIFLHLWVEALLLVNVAIGAIGIVILSLLAFGGNAKKSVWLTWIPTVGIGFLVAKGSLPSGDFLLWLAIMGAVVTVYSVYRLMTGKRLQ